MHVYAFPPPLATDTHEDGQAFPHAVQTPQHLNIRDTFMSKEKKIHLHFLLS